MGYFLIKNNLPQFTLQRLVFSHDLAANASLKFGFATGVHREILAWSPWVHKSGRGLYHFTVWGLLDDGSLMTSEQRASTFIPM